MKLLKIVGTASSDCSSMFHKTDWNFRFSQETKRYKDTHPDYIVMVRSSDRNRNYTLSKCDLLREMKLAGIPDKEIALKLNRSYCSVVYKERELRNR